MLAVEQVSCVRQHRPLFQPVSFALHPQDLVLIEGANGVGKSSLLRTVCGLSSSGMGTIHWQGQTLSAVRDDYLQHVHYVGHQNGLKLDLSVAENIRLMSLLAMSDFCNEHLITELGLNHLKLTPTRQLSAGQKRKLALLKLFLFPKKLWLLDEPLTALDANTQTFFLAKLEEHLKNGGMAVISSHHALSLQHPRTTLVRLNSC
jgi:heme exporter protein A